MLRTMLLLAAVLAPGALHAQGAPGGPLPPLGARVRVTAGVEAGRIDRITGSFAGVEEGFFTLDLRESGVQRVPVGEITRLEVSNGRGRGSGALRGMKIGLAVGVIAGGLFGAAVATGDARCEVFCPGSSMSGALLGAALASGVTVPVSALVGLSVGRERWSTLWRNSAPPSRLLPRTR